MSPSTNNFKKLSENINRDPKRRRRVERHKTAIREALSLAEMRNARHLSQTAVADKLGVSQTNVSQTERRDIDDVYLSTISKYVAALGGQLEIRAVFDDQVVELRPPAT